MSEEEPRTDEIPAVEGAPEEEPGTPKPAPVENLRILEALIFASDEFLTAARLKAILPGNPGGREITSMIAKINRQLQKERHPFEIVEVGGGYQFKTVAYYHPWVRQIFQEKAAKRLSIQALECLSIIAYRQPLSKAEIEAIRGVISDGAMKTLLEKRLITITGRSDKPGRPLLYGTTPDFLRYFGLNRIADLPNIEEFEAMVRQKIENLPIDELAAAQAGALAQSESPLAEGAGTDVEAFERRKRGEDGGSQPDEAIDAAAGGGSDEGWAWLNGESDPAEENTSAGVSELLPEEAASVDAGEAISDVSNRGEPVEEVGEEPVEVEEVSTVDEREIEVSDAASVEIEIKKPAEED